MASKSLAGAEQRQKTAGNMEQSTAENILGAALTLLLPLLELMAPALPRQWIVNTLEIGWA